MKTCALLVIRYLAEITSWPWEEIDVKTSKLHTTHGDLHQKVLDVLWDTIREGVRTNECQGHNPRWSMEHLKIYEKNGPQKERVHEYLRQLKTDGDEELYEQPSPCMGCLIGKWKWLALTNPTCGYKWSIKRTAWQNKNRL